MCFDHYVVIFRPIKYININKMIFTFFFVRLDLDYKLNCWVNIKCQNK